jgi:hypothetical protein
MSASVPSELESIHCGNCYYDLRGLTSDRCPECGLTIDATRGRFILWERRAKLGWMRTFRSTVLMATFYPWQLGRACVSPVDSRSAKVFRWYAVIQAWLLLSVIYLIAACQSDRLGLQGGRYIQSDSDLAMLWGTGSDLLPILPIGLLITLILGTSIAPLFHIRRLPPLRRNRAMAISYYACAPLAFVPFTCVALGLVLLFLFERWPTIDANFILWAATSTAWISSYLIMTAMWLIPWIAMLSFGGGNLRTLGVAIGQLVQWTIAVFVGLIFLPMAAGLLKTIYENIR